MPELPEVETVRKGLELLVVGQTIAAVRVDYDPMIGADVADFCQQLTGQTIMAVGRRGKYLLLYLTDLVLISHLRMEGKYHFFPDAPPVHKHFHVFFTFTDGSCLIYQDVRKFGTMELVEKTSLDSYFSAKKLGPEPVESDLDVADFQKALAASKKPVKSRLLDQRAVAGLGNIYVDEVLFAASIHPQKPSNSLSAKEVTSLRQAIVSVMALAIEKGGSTIRSYRNALGMDGTMQDYLQVYGRTNQSCFVCQTPVIKFQLGGRGTHICPNCQVQP